MSRIVVGDTLPSLGHAQPGPEVEADHWVQCDRCTKWRRVPPNVAEAIEDDAEWYCEYNPNQPFAGCEVPQELTNEEIDQEAAEAEEERQSLPKLPAVWQLIRGNFYSHRKRKKQDEDDIMVCSCPPPWRGGDGCGPNCINRMLCIECTEDFCPCEDKCNNQMFTRKQYAKLAVRRAGPKGFGLYAEEDVTAGQFLIEYIGEVLEEEEYTRRKQYYIQNGQRHFYFMNIGNGEVIDACRKGNHARFINHSCEPNCETQKWMVQGELAIGLYTLRKIKAGEELTFDYNFERYGDKPMRCFCGSKKCRKFIGGTQESTADIVELGDAEDVTYDPEPVMVREEETDATVQDMLDKEVGNIRRNWDIKMLSRLQQLCQQKGIDWSINLDDGGRTASTQAPAVVVSSPEEAESEDEGSKAAPALSKVAASPASSSAPGSDTLARSDFEGVESHLVRGPPKATLKQQKRKRGAIQDELETAAAATAKKQQQEERKRQRLEQQEKRRLKQQQVFIRMQAEAEKRFERLKQIQQQKQQQQPSRKKLGKQRQNVGEAEQLPSADQELQDSDMGSGAEGQQHVLGADADLEDEMSDEDIQIAEPAEPLVLAQTTSAAAAACPPVHRRVKIVQIKKHRPSTGPGSRPAAAGSDAGKDKKTAGGRRSFLTLAVSTAGKTLKRRSEVDRRLEQLVQKQSWKLKEPGQQSVIKVLRMFNLCDITPRQADPVVQHQLQQQGGSKPGSPVKQSPAHSEHAEQPQQQSDATCSALQQENRNSDMQIGQQQPSAAAASGEGGAAGDQLGQPQLPQSLMPLQPLKGAELEARERESEARFKARQRARMADLGMLLDVVLVSSSEKLKKEWVACGILTQLQQTLGRVPFTAEYSSVLVKVIRVLEHLPLTPDDLYTVRSAHGTFADLIRRMASSATDWEVRRRSHQLLKRYAAATCSDATLLQLYHVPGPNGKPYLLSLHLPPPQIQRLLALLPKNAPPPRSQQHRGGEQRGMAGTVRGDARNGSATAEQQSSPSTSHGAGMASEGPANGPPPHWRQQQQPEEVQYMQGNRPLGRGASSSQLAIEGWDVGPPGPWGEWPAPPAPPPGVAGVFRPSRHSRTMQQRSPVRPYAGRFAPPDGLPVRGHPGMDWGPDRGERPTADRGDRGPLFGPPEGLGGGPGGWNIPPGRDRGPPVEYGLSRVPPGRGFDLHYRGRDWDRQRGWDCDRFERSDRDLAGPDSKDRDGRAGLWHHHGQEAPGRPQRSSYDSASKQLPRDMPPISDLFADAPVRPPDAAADDLRNADMQPMASSKGWQQHDLQAGPSNGRTMHSGWDAANQQHYGSEPVPVRSGSDQKQRQQAPVGVLQASLEDLCSLGLYTYSQEPAAAAWLQPAFSFGADAAAAGGNLSPIVSGRFSPPLADNMVVGQPGSATPVLPADRGLAVEDAFCLLQDAVVADKTPGVAVSSLVAADLTAQQQQPMTRGAAVELQGYQLSAAVHVQQQQEPGGWTVGTSRLQLQQQHPSDAWDQPGPGFEAVVSDAVKHRLGKYVQPDHPNRITKEDAQQLYRKLRREVVDKEVTAFAARQAQGQFRPIGKADVEAKIKDFVRQSIRRLHAARATGAPDGLSTPGN